MRHGKMMYSGHSSESERLMQQGGGYPSQQGSGNNGPESNI